MKCFSFNIENNMAVRKGLLWAPERDVINILSMFWTLFYPNLIQNKKKKHKVEKQIS